LITAQANQIWLFLLVNMGDKCKIDS